MAKEDKIERIVQIRKQLVRDALLAIYQAKSGHTGTSLSVVDIVATLIGYPFLRGWWEKKPNRDLLILSKGHAAPTLYAALAMAGYINKQELGKLRRIDGILEGHPSTKIPGVDSPSGSLGVGAAVAVGRALADKLLGRDRRVFVILGDGELQEGIVWECFSIARSLRLKNLFFIIDRNGMQLSGPTETIRRMEPITKKLRSFGLNVFVTNGHDVRQLVETFEKALHADGPKAIVAYTVKGKYLETIEWDEKSHGFVPDPETIEKIITRWDE